MDDNVVPLSGDIDPRTSRVAEGELVPPVRVLQGAVDELAKGGVRETVVILTHDDGTLSVFGSHSTPRCCFAMQRGISRLARTQYLHSEIGGSNG